jgi:hypothetical protein
MRQDVINAKPLLERYLKTKFKAFDESEVLWLLEKVAMKLRKENALRINDNIKKWKTRISK